MTEDHSTQGPDPDAVRVPLPPEAPAPAPEAELTPEAEPGPALDEAPASAASPAPPAPAEPNTTPADGPAGPDATEPTAEAERDWWRSDAGGQWHDGFSERGQEAMGAAIEIGAHISEAIAERLPDPHAAAAQRGLDISWLRLKVNLPAMPIAGVMVWSGGGLAQTLQQHIGEDGIFAPVGWVLLVVLAVGALSFLPIGSTLAHAFADLVTGLARGLWALLLRAWRIPYIGYLLRLAVAVVVWVFLFTVATLIGRAVLHFLTGV